MNEHITIIGAGNLTVSSLEALKRSRSKFTINVVDIDKKKSSKLKKFDIKLNTTVMPFIIRGVKLWGIDSSGASIRRREFLWNEAVKLIDFNKLKSFTKSLSFSELLDTYPKLLEGKFFGRAIVNPNK